MHLILAAKVLLYEKLHLILAGRALLDGDDLRADLLDHPGDPIAQFRNIIDGSELDTAEFLACKTRWDGSIQLFQSPPKTEIIHSILMLPTSARAFQVLLSQSEI